MDFSQLRSIEVNTHHYCSQRLQFWRVMTEGRLEKQESGTGTGTGIGAGTGIGTGTGTGAGTRTSCFRKRPGKADLNMF